VLKTGITAEIVGQYGSDRIRSRNFAKSSSDSVSYSIVHLAYSARAPRRLPKNLLANENGELRFNASVVRWIG
jgi:hypothetical protein